jgi:hypothetical protein
MKLFEIFNKVIPYEWTIDEHNMGEATFSVGGNVYSVSMTNLDTHFDKSDTWRIEFALHRRNSQGKMIYTISMSGTGHSIEVMSTVQAICKDWFSKHPARRLIMSGATPRRLSLYTRLLRTLKPTWKIHTQLHTITAAATGGGDDENI